MSQAMQIGPKPTLTPDIEHTLVGTSDVFFSHFTRLWMAAGVLLCLLAWTWVPAIQAFAVLLLVTGVAGTWLWQRGRLHSARASVVWPLCAFIVVLPWFVNGIATPVLFAMPMAVLLAGWLLGRRQAAAATALFTATALAYLVLEAGGLYTPPQPPRPIAAWGLTIATSVLLAGVTVWALITSYARLLSRQLQLQQDLDAALSDAHRSRDALDALAASVYMKDVDHRYTYVNKAVADLCGRRPEEMLGTTSDMLFSLEAISDPRESDRRVLEQGEHVQREERAVVATTGETRYFWSDKSPLFDARRHIVGLVGVSTDITQKKQLELALQRAQQETAAINERLSSVLRFSEAILLNSPVAMAVYASDGRCVQTNDAHAKLVGATRAQLLGQNLYLATAFSTPDVLAMCRQVLGDQVGRRMDVELTGAQGRRVYCECRVLPTVLEGQPHLLMQVIDLSARKRIEDELRQLAFHDTLTRLPNRRLLLDRLQQCLRSRRRRRCHLAVLYLDLNRFKEVNDTHGHEAGDRLLVEVARRLTNRVRACDTVARLGGDEFVVLLEMPDAMDARPQAQVGVVAEKIRSSLGEDYRFGNVSLQVSASIGLKVIQEDEDDPEQILMAADTAMYENKRSRGATTS